MAAAAKSVEPREDSEKEGILPSAPVGGWQWIQ